MKLAEALSIRADLQKRIAQMDSRLNAVCRVQEGDAPIEDPKEIFKELNNCLSQAEELVIKINKTNQSTVLADGKTITEKIARRDMLRTHAQILQNVLNNLFQGRDRYTRSEIKYVTTVDAVELRKKADSLSKSLREIDMEIQEANWTVDLID